MDDNFYFLTIFFWLTCGRKFESTIFESLSIFSRKRFCVVSVGIDRCLAKRYSGNNRKAKEIDLLHSTMCRCVVSVRGLSKYYVCFKDSFCRRFEDDSDIQKYKLLVIQSYHWHWRSKFLVKKFHP